MSRCFYNRIDWSLCPEGFHLCIEFIKAQSLSQEEYEKAEKAYLDHLRECQIDPKEVYEEMNDHTLYTDSQ